MNEDLYDCIQAYVSAQSEGTLDDRQRLEMERLLIANPTARKIYVQYVAETASLRLWASAGASSAERETPQPALSVRPAARRRPWTWAAAAAVVLAGAILTSLLIRGKLGHLATTGNPTEPAAATLAAASLAVWEAPANPPQPGSPIGRGVLTLKSGTVRLAFASGAEAIVFGPARFEIGPASAMTLHEGKLTAQVEKRAAGFTVETPVTSLVDLGTEFGVLVAASGETEAHVLRGAVEVRAKGSTRPPVRLTENNAASVTPDGSVSTLAVRPDDFVHQLPMIDLADVVAGGDGTQGRRGAGIDVRRGTIVTANPSRTAEEGDGQIRPVPGRPFVACVFVPLRGVPVTLDPAGHTFAEFPCRTKVTWYPLWAGGIIPLPADAESQWRPAAPTKLGPRDYAAPPHSVLLVHPNKGITFDLGAIRRGHAGIRLGRFRAACQNTGGQMTGGQNTEKSDLWVFVDGALRFKRSPILREGPPFDVNVDLAEGDRYLTLVTTDGGDGYAGDWVTLGDARLE